MSVSVFFLDVDILVVSGHLDTLSKEQKEAVKVMRKPVNREDIKKEVKKMIIDKRRSKPYVH